MPLSILSNYFFQAKNFKFQNVLIKLSLQLCNISSKGNLKSLFYFFIIQTIKNKPFTKNIDQFKIPEFVLHIASIRDKFIWNWIKIKPKKHSKLWDLILKHWNWLTEIIWQSEQTAFIHGCKFTICLALRRKTIVSPANKVTFLTT